MSLFLFQHPFAGSQRAPQGLRGSSRRRGARALTLLILLVMPALWLGAQPTSTVEMAPRSVTRLSDWWQAAQAEKPAPIAMDVVADVIFVDPHWKNLWVLEPSGIGSYIAIAGEIPPLRVGHRLRLHGIFTPTTRLSTEDIHISVLEERAPPAPTSISGDVMNVGRFQHLRVRIAGVVESQRNVDPTHVELQLLSEGHRLPVTVLIGPSDLVPALTGAAITADGLYAPTYDDKGRPSGVALWAQDFRSIQVKGWLASDPRLELPLRNLSELDPTLNARWVRVTGEIADARPGESFTLVDGEHRLTARTGQQVLPAVGTSAMVIGRLATDGGSVLLHEALIPAAITSQTANRPPEVLRNLGQWWAATTAGRREPLPLDTVAEVLFYDRSYRNLWINNAEGGYYIAVGDRPLDLRLGDRIRLEGLVTPGDNPSTQRLDVTVLEHGAPPEAIGINGRLREIERWRNRWVRVAGYVESQERLDGTHLRLHLLADDFRVETMILVPDGRPEPDFTGSMVEVEGVYVPTGAPDGSLASLLLGLQSAEQVRERRPLAEDPRFHLPITTLDEIPTRAPGSWVRVTGRVQDQDPGRSLMLRDGRGQVLAQALQLTRLKPNEAVELIGRVAHDAGRIVLTEALFVAREGAKEDPRPAEIAELRAASQVIALAPAEAERALPVHLSGVVTWSHPSSRHFFLLDGTRGARVQLPLGAAVPPVGGAVIAIGTTAAGPFASEVVAQELRVSAVLQHLRMPDPRPTTLEQALTGVDEAMWVELRGYVREVRRDGPLARLALLTSGGEFHAWVPDADMLGTLQGAFIRVRGVCAGLANNRRQLTGIELWAPTPEALRVDAPAPADRFALPLESVASLQQFNVLQSSSRLVRIGATVLHQIPGRVVFADDAGEGIRILSTTGVPLAPGDRIEAVGLPGRENSQLVLREAVYRRVGRNSEPAATVVPAGSPVLREDLDGRMAQMEATLLGAVRRGAHLRLMLQSGETAFDAVLADPTGALDWQAGSRLRLTGVYELIRDEYRAPRSIEVQLRRPEDVQVLQLPSWWTAGRALGVSSSLVCMLLLGLGWVRSLRQRVRSQTQEIRSQLAKVASLETRHRGIIESASDFIFTADLKGRITSINPAGEQLTGYSRDEALALEVRDLIAPEDQAAGLAMLDLHTENDGSAAFQCRFRRKDGGLVWVETSARLLREDGRATGLLGVVRDFTARRQHEEALTEARDAAEASARAKSTFLANMSHEIRTPMNGVIGMSNLLLDTQLDRQQLEFAETIRNSAESLLTVLNDILDFSKIEAGKLQFETLDFDLNETVESTLELMSARATAKGLEVAAFVPEDIPGSVRGDPGRLRQVLLNLLGNAIKFTTAGDVVVRLALIQQDERTVRVRFEVQDTGIGLSEKAQAELFRPFMQADSSTTRKYGGTGLGLAICKQIVELMGGEIGVTSEEGRGSIFWFSVPFARGTTSAPEHPVVAASAHLLDGLHVAIIDDNATNRAVLQHYVAGWGATSVCFAGGPEALAGLRASAAAGTPFTFALLDFQMPEMNGLMLAEALQADPALRRIKCLLLTSIDQRFSADELKAHGIHQMMTKPIRRNELRAAIRSAVLAGAPLPAPVAPRPARPDDPDSSFALRVLVAEDNVVNQRVARLQLEKLGHRVDLVANGLEALEALERVPYDLILMDCQMPEMDGYEATRRIRRSSRRSDIMIVAMTAHAMEGDREACLACGMNDYLSKPVRLPLLQELLHRLEPALAAQRARSESSATGAAAATAQS